MFVETNVAIVEAKNQGGAGLAERAAPGTYRNTLPYLRKCMFPIPGAVTSDAFPIRALID